MCRGETWPPAPRHSIADGYCFGRLVQCPDRRHGVGDGHSRVFILTCIAGVLRCGRDAGGVTDGTADGIGRAKRTWWLAVAVGRRGTGPRFGSRGCVLVAAAGRRRGLPGCPVSGPAAPIGGGGWPSGTPGGGPSSCLPAVRPCPVPGRRARPVPAQRAGPPHRGGRPDGSPDSATICSDWSFLFGYPQEAIWSMPTMDTYTWWGEPFRDAAATRLRVASASPRMLVAQWMMAADAVSAGSTP
jgi:hypothetical protein